MQASGFFKGLADETRLKLLVAMKQRGEICVCELTELLHETQPKISRHLALLRNTGIVKTERRGKWIYYRLCDEMPHWQRDVLDCLEPQQFPELKLGAQPICI